MQEITCVRYSYRELAYATNIFSNNNLIRESEIGWLYQGRLPDKRPVAVRRLKKPVCCSRATIEQLQKEVKFLSLINHPNLIRLLGCCLEPDESLLVYEFQQNGNLAEHLHKERGCGLNWGSRFNIALETADGLSHLNHACNPPLFHTNLKSSNILLDENFRPTITGFGISTSMFTKDFSTLPESKIGYIDPSYAQTYRFTEKSDVYSFGVILMELVSGKKVVDFRRPAGEFTLAALAFTKKKLGYTAFKGLFDPQLKSLGKTCLSTVHEVALLAIKCMALDADARPTIQEVFDQLRMIQDREIIRTKRDDSEYFE
jgi:serine/threonine protein kinase